MKGWNPFGKIDMEIGSFLKTSAFNKEYMRGSTENTEDKLEDKKNKELDDK